MSVFCILLGPPRSGTTLLGHAVTHAFGAAWPKEIFSEAYAEPALDYRRATDIKQRANFFNFRREALQARPELSYPSRENQSQLFRNYLDQLVEHEGAERFLIDAKYTSLHHLDFYWRTPREKPGFISIVRQLGLPAVHLKRRNTFALYCSLAYAETTGVWVAVDDPTPQTIVIDTARCLRYMAEMQEMTKRVDDWLSGHPMFTLEYETMIKDGEWSTEVTDTFMAVFGTRPAAPLTLPYRKVTPPLRQLVQNIDEVLASTRNSPFRNLIEDALQESGGVSVRSSKAATLPRPPAESPPPQTLRGPAALISSDPLIISTPTVWTLPLALPLGAFCADRKAVFLIPLHKNFDESEAAERAVAAREYKQQYPRHELIFVTNTPEQATFFRRAGAEAFFANHNIFVSEEVFRPLADVPVLFDAVYDARPVPIKRHELAAEIGSVAYVSFTGDVNVAHQREVVAGLLQRQGHRIFNEIVDGLPKWMPPPKVNAVFAQASVGLCLSEEEGAMYSSMEYMLAGLPIVSTPSRGGRDIFFDPDYCMIVEPTPRAVREGVEMLRDRKIPRDYVRSRTLANLATHRNRYLAFIADIKARHGVPRSYDMNWTFRGAPFHKYRIVEEHAREFFGTA